MNRDIRAGRSFTRWALVRWAGAALALLVLSGCAALAAQVAAQVAEKIYEDRSAGEQFTDVKIHARILKFLANRNPELPLDVNTDVWGSRVLFTGTVDNPALPRLIEKEALADSRVRAVYNHIRVVSKAVVARRRRQKDVDGAGAPEEGKAARRANDVWIGTKVKVRLLAAGEVKSFNYRWQSVLGRVYIIGTARTREERDIVEGIIRATKGVSGATSYIRVR
jgi:osmotically-inducible protein OsmY